MGSQMGIEWGIAVDMLPLSRPHPSGSPSAQPSKAATDRGRATGAAPSSRHRVPALRLSPDPTEVAKVPRAFESANSETPANSLGEAMKLGLPDRCGFAFLVVLVVSIGMAFRLFALQVLEGAQARQLAERIWLRRIELAPARGIIYSRNMQPLAASQQTYSIWADPHALRVAARKVWGKGLSDREIVTRLAHSLCRLLKTDQVSEERVARRLASHLRNRSDGRPILVRFIWVARYLPEAAVANLKHILAAKRTPHHRSRTFDPPEWEILRAGIGLSLEMRRVYPFRRLAAATLGFVNLDNVGCYGVERSWDEVLRGKRGTMELEVDAVGRPLPTGYHAYLPPQPGKSLILTLDEQIQRAAEAVMDEAMRKLKPRKAIALVLEPKTGDILAMVSKPDFDPNDYHRFPPERFLNHALAFVYEPGSTFKPLVAAALLDSGAITEQTTVVCDGVWKTDHFLVRCWVTQKGIAPHGAETLKDALRDSCNIAMAKFALRTSYQRLYAVLSKFGIGRKLGVLAGYEEAGWLDPPERPLPRRAVQHHQATLGFGQGVAVTPMHLAVAYAALANHGKVMRPRIVRGIQDEQTGQTQWLAPQEIGSAVSPLTAMKVREMLVAAVEEGTGKRAKLNGVRVAGKTGTATKVVHGRYDPTKVVVSFFGFFPADDPKWVIGIVLDEPAYGKWGGEVAAPLFAALGQQILWRVQPPRPLSLTHDLTAPSFFRLTFEP
ncbi:MAG: hypothetical protein IMHGJWDQ_000841 [Candidatus Fervidibacter sp.]